MRYRAAFTLIELLVVISIISVLVSILLPALAHARGRAQVLQSMSNARQQGIAMQMYFNDYDGHILQKEGYGAGVPPYWDGQLMPYAGAAEVFQAPADTLERVYDQWPDRRSYAINTDIVVRSNGYHRIGEMPDPAASMIVMEYFAAWNVLNSYGNAYVDKNTYASYPERWLMRPHPGGAIVHLFLDGHATSLAHGQLPGAAWARR